MNYEIHLNDTQKFSFHHTRKSPSL